MTYNNESILTSLNQALNSEMEAIQKYFVYSKISEFLGLNKLAEKLKKISIDEMNHSDLLLGRILVLNGVPGFDYHAKFNVAKSLDIAEHVKKVLADIVLDESTAVSNYQIFESICSDSKDHVTASLFEQILKDEESHLHWAEKNSNICKAVGLENYIANYC